MDDVFRILLQLLAPSVFIWTVWRLVKQPRERPSMRSAAVLVLGDIGRSPRMMYHAESFATAGFETFLIGYPGSKPVPSLLSIPHVHFLYLSTPPKHLSKLPFVVAAPRKVLLQVFGTLHALLVRMPHPPEFIIVQNPPSIPTLALVWLVSHLRGSKVIIDWHNLGYSILALKLGERHPLVRIAKAFEAYFGRSAYAHLFVTQAMRDHLVSSWHLQGHKAVLHDRPPAHFHRASPSETHDLFLRLQPSLERYSSLTAFLPFSSPPLSTPFTTLTPASRSSTGSSSLGSPSAFDTILSLPEPRADRPALLVSSTSWTPDEDFGLLRDALVLYERRAREREEKGGEVLPKVLMVVTGKGPLRERYMGEIEQLQNGAGGEGDEPWRYVRCVSLWLEAEDYPLLLGSADLGISLHASSSALDLPMKVVDMFGCGLPVCALGFACLPELVQDGVNGLVFKDATQLAEQLETLLTGHPEASALASLRESLVHAEEDGSWGSWAQNWDRVVRPLVLRDAGNPTM
ncbi:glycosyltransferase family 33 protein [Gelatoporia subvermispora B]|uniref:Chitobiosyldiphosphodolichol beta-mannosyltransferase n=1 Tax=Ceriporiopsis subvermispora (strain B) TaxID=914234 RepID=M2RS29_CERS8|nr:glycosyltransferase family 33 protein [Gelatoporia subvermispora B]